MHCVLWGVLQPIQQLRLAGMMLLRSVCEFVASRSNPTCNLEPWLEDELMCDIRIRWMTYADMLDVLAIEKMSFDSPWGEDDFIRCLRQRNCIGVVAVRDSRVVGYMVYELGQPMRLLNIAVHRAYRRNGVGIHLLEWLISRLQERRNRLDVTVRETNLGAQLFFRSQGFKAIEVLRNIFEDTDEDAYLMEYRLASMELVGQE
jgi:[ribosomal protein S18]-alanine N-acetyltransferase